jgi:hypothetical protein
MGSAVCPIPKAVSHEAAVKKLAEIQQRRKSLSLAAQERMAARELGEDIADFRRALKSSVVPDPNPLPPVPKPVPQPTPEPAPVRPPPSPARDAYDAGWNASKTTKTFDLDAAEARYEKKYGRSDRTDFAAGWGDHASGYDKYHSFTPPIAVKKEAQLILRQDDAQKAYDAVRLRRKSLDKAASERVAAKELGVDIKEFRAALKGDLYAPDDLNAATLKKAKHWTDDLPPIEADVFGESNVGHVDAFYTANTNYDFTDRDTYINCAKVVNAYEMRRRGFDVIASVKSANKNVWQLSNMWRLPGASHSVEVKMVKTKRQFEDVAWANDPVGSRYQIVVVWPGRQSSHIFSAEKMPGGRIEYYDAQVHRLDASEYFRRIEPGSTMFGWRVDNAVPTEDVKFLFENKGKSWRPKPKPEPTTTRQFGERPW